MTTLLLSVLNAVFSVAGTLANGLVLIVIFNNQDLRIGANFFVASLATADLLVCALCQTSYIYFLNVEWSNVRFLVFKSISYVGLHASFGNLLLLTTHRFIALKRPFSHWTLFRGKTIAVCVVSVWTFSIAVAMIFTFTVVKKIEPYCHLIMLVTFIFVHAHILLIVHKQRRQIHRQQESLSFNHIVAGIRYDELTTGTLALLCGSSVLLFLPDVLVQFLKLDGSIRFHSTFTCMFINSFLNPCIYVWRGKRFRKVLFNTSHLSVAREWNGEHCSARTTCCNLGNALALKCTTERGSSHALHTTPNRISVNGIGVDNLDPVATARLS